METFAGLAKLGLVGIAILLMAAVLALYFRVSLSLMYFITNDNKYKKYLTDEERDKVKNMGDYFKVKYKILLLSLVPLFTALLFFIIVATN